MSDTPPTIIASSNIELLTLALGSAFTQLAEPLDPSEEGLSVREILQHSHTPIAHSTVQRHLRTLVDKGLAYVTRELRANILDEWKPTPIYHLNRPAAPLSLNLSESAPPNIKPPQIGGAAGEPEPAKIEKETHYE